MKAYLSLFKLRMNAGLQYRGAALSGIFTQIVWGFLLITLYQLLGSSTMAPKDIATYFWLNQAFIAMNAIWTMDISIFNDIETGDVQYHLIRPQDIYMQWFVRNGAHRLSRTILRATPLLLIVFFLPEPYRMNLPYNSVYFMGFLISMLIAFLTQLAVGNIMAALTMKTKQALGVRILFTSMFDFLDGGNIPYVYFPNWIQCFLKLTFFYSVKSAPFLIYMGSLSIGTTLMFQLVWLVTLVGVGYIMVNYQLRRIEVFGG